MKKTLSIVALASLSSFSLADNPAGCGLGTAVVFPDANEWHEFVLAATTNGTSGNQTFGMTSGTLGCEEANGPLAQTQLFIDENMDQLAIDTARGQGETLAALAQVIGVTVADQPVFEQTLKANFDQLFKAGGNSAATYQAIRKAMGEVPVLQPYVS